MQTGTLLSSSLHPRNSRMQACAAMAYRPTASQSTRLGVDRYHSDDHGHAEGLRLGADEP